MNLPICYTCSTKPFLIKKELKTKKVITCACGKNKVIITKKGIEIITDWNSLGDVDV